MRTNLRRNLLLKCLKCEMVKSLNRKKQKGFSLTELVVVIVMIFILSVISGPIYNSYSGKARQAEGYALLGTILSAERNYYDEYDRFWFEDLTTCNNTILGIDARNNNYYTLIDMSLAGLSLRSSLYQKHCFLVFARATNYPQIGLYYNITSGATYCNNIGEIKNF